MNSTYSFLKMQQVSFARFPGFPDWYCGLWRDTFLLRCECCNSLKAHSIVVWVGWGYIIQSSPRGSTSEVGKVCAWAQGEWRLGVILSCCNFLLAPPVENAVTHFMLSPPVENAVTHFMPATHEDLPHTRSISLPSEFSFTSTKPHVPCNRTPQLGPRQRCEESHDAVGIQQFVAWQSSGL